MAALEGYYGPPLDPAARHDLVAWLATEGYDAYLYSPKDDPYQRARWREPYPEPELATLRDLADRCHAAGLELGLTISPGLDWRAGDAGEVDHLVAKLGQLLTAGADSLGIAWDDVPGQGAELGTEHGRAVADAVARVGPDAARWFTCPIDYAVDRPTPYLAAFAAAVGDGVPLAWTGPGVVTGRLTAADVEAVAGPLGRPLLFAENFPVNDLGMAGVLHLGPYPERDPDAMAAVAGVTVNFMDRPLASRVGLALAARAWRDPGADRAATWRQVVAGVPGLAPLARACRSWLDDPGPDPDLRAWAEAAGPDDRRLRHHLDAGCRDGLDPALAAELAPWLDRWDQEAAVMAMALSILEDDAPPPFRAVALLALAWAAAGKERVQVFGIRSALYPSTHHDGTALRARPDAVVRGSNLTDLVVERALARSA